MEAERLADVGGGPFPNTTLKRGIVGSSREHDHRQGVASVAQAGQHPPSVHPRHHEVEDEEIRPRGGDPLDGLGAVARRIGHHVPSLTPLKEEQSGAAGQADAAREGDAAPQQTVDVDQPGQGRGRVVEGVETAVGVLQVVHQLGQPGGLVLHAAQRGLVAQAPGRQLQLPLQGHQRRP